MNKLVIQMVLTLMVMAQAITSSAQPGVKLFSSPQVRAELERRRLGLVELTPEPEIDILASLQEPEVEEELVYALSGTLLKEDGTSIVWLNGEAVSEANLPDSISVVRPPTQGQIIIAARGQNFIVKPGQVLNATLGILFESYEWEEILEQKRLQELVEQAEAAASSAEEFSGELAQIQ